MPLQTPVLFVVFNRLDTTSIVFDAIRKAQPKKLYIAADGPRPNNASDAEKCQLTRELVVNIDWDCELKTLFRDENLGCGLGPAGAYDWFFENEEEGIILEDDCLPDPTFFRFCEEMLEKYRYDTRIMHITGSNFQKGWQHDNNFSYYFSTFPHEWGWATWRRAWRLYDFGVKKYPELIEKDYFKDYFGSALEKKYRLAKIHNSYNNPDANWWDYQWSFAIFSNNGLSIIPNVNLIENIGLGVDATHTLSSKDHFKHNIARPIQFPLQHPSFVMRNRNSERRYFKALMKSIFKRKLLSLLGFKGYNFNG
ncbi:MAG: nucleotide-diphospho-sugar transferase [Bacteroidota bacterium]